jgi:hypothetical protein
MRATTELYEVAMTLTTLPNLDALIGLARQDGVDVRPTLVRVLTDLFVQKAAHPADEEHRYTELALWLLAGVDVPTRVAVAKKLATYPHAPRLVVRRLARDVIEVAEPVLATSLSLTSDDLLAIIRDFGPAHAAAIGTRHVSLTPKVSRPAAVATTEIRVAERPAAPSAAESSEVQKNVESVVSPSEPAGVPVQNGPTPADAAPASHDDGIAILSERFLNAGTAERRLLLERIESHAPAAREPVLSGRREDLLGELEAAAMQRRPDDFAGILEQGLRIAAARARQIVYDDTGEPVVIVLKGIEAASDALVRILLFLNPRVGQSVERVFSLVDLHEQLSLPAAQQMVATWQNASAQEKPKPEYRPVHWNDERPGARRMFATHARRILVQVPDGRATRRTGNSSEQ